MSKKHDIDKIKEELSADRAKQAISKGSDYVSSGSTLINLALTGNIHRGFLKGQYYLLVGDSGSGKTWLTQTVFAEASINKHFNDYRFVFFDGEGGALMDIERYFGAKAAERIETLNPLTVEEFYYAMDGLHENGSPYIAVLDSESVLSSAAEQSKHEENRKAHTAGKEATGDYGDGKAKIHSRKLRVVNNRLKENGSILIMVSQTRDNIGFGAQFNPQVRSGGRALTFYACCEIWTKHIGHVKKNVKGKERQIGVNIKVVVKKNRNNGKLMRPVEMSILHSTGIDDVGDCVDFLVDEEHWKKGKGGIITREFDDLDGPRESLITGIEDSGQERILRATVSEVWDEIEEACTVIRKHKYNQE